MALPRSGPNLLSALHYQRQSIHFRHVSKVAKATIDFN